MRERPTDVTHVNVTKLPGKKGQKLPNSPQSVSDVVAARPLPTCGFWPPGCVTRTPEFTLAIAPGDASGDWALTSRLRPPARRLQARSPPGREGRSSPASEGRARVRVTRHGRGEPHGTGHAAVRAETDVGCRGVTVTCPRPLAGRNGK